MTMVKPNTHIRKHMKIYFPVPPNASGDQPPTVHNTRYSYLCGETQKEDNWISVSSENGEHWANLRIAVRKNMTGFCRIQLKKDYNGLYYHKF